MSLNPRSAALMLILSGLLLAGIACTNEPDATAALPPPQEAGENRLNCDQIRGTVYLSNLERAWFLGNCLAGSSGERVSCHPSYPDICLLTNVGDYDCEGSGENGPHFVRGPFRITGPDAFVLDRDGDRIACE